MTGILAAAPLAANAPPTAGEILLEIGAALVLLSFVARFASKWAFSPIPFYLLCGLALSGVQPLELTEEFLDVGARIGVILVLFLLGLEYTGAELSANLRSGLPTGLIDAALNFFPGLLFGFLLGFEPIAAVLLGGATYVSSSGVIAKVLDDLGRLGNRETPVILSVLVLEDLAMAIFLPLVAVLLAGGGVLLAIGSISGAVAIAVLILAIAIKRGDLVSRLIRSRSDEVVLLTVLGVVLLVAGSAEELRLSAAVGAFLIGIALSGPVAEQARLQLGPLRDLFAAVFFLFFGSVIDLGSLPAVLLPAFGLAVLTGATKVCTGWLAAKRAGIGPRGKVRTGLALVSRGEFSVVIAGLGVTTGVEGELGPLVAAYVLITALVGPILMRFSDQIATSLLKRSAISANR